MWKIQFNFNIWIIDIFNLNIVSFNYFDCLNYCFLIVINTPDHWVIVHGDAGKLGNYPILSVLQGKFARVLYVFHDFRFASLDLPPLLTDRCDFDVHETLHDWVPDPYSLSEINLGSFLMHTKNEEEQNKPSFRRVNSHSAATVGPARQCMPIDCSSRASESFNRSNRPTGSGPARGPPNGARCSDKNLLQIIVIIKWWWSSFKKWILPK